MPTLMTVTNDTSLIFLRNGRTYLLPAELVNRLEAAMQKLSTTAVKGNAETLRNHFGDDAWDALAGKDPSLAGRCISYLVSQHRIPFEAVGIDRNSKAQMYARI